MYSSYKDQARSRLDPNFFIENFNFLTGYFDSVNTFDTIGNSYKDPNTTKYSFFETATSRYQYLDCF